MDIKALGSKLAEIGLPLLGAALPIPGGAALGKALAIAIGAESDKPEAIANALLSPEAQQKAREFAMTHEVTILKIVSDAEATEATNVTKRWEADMASQSKLAANIRPMVLLYLLGLYAVFALMSAFDLNVQKEYVTLLGSWGMVVMTAYFGGRTVEKIMAIRAQSDVGK